MNTSRHEITDIVRDGPYHRAVCSCDFHSKRRSTIDKARHSGRIHVTSMTRDRRAKGNIRVFIRPHGVAIYRGGETIRVQVNGTTRVITDHRWPNTSIEMMAMMLDEMMIPA